MFALVKDEIKVWLKKLGLSREWLADKIGVSKRTVDNWLSSNIDIPERSVAIIQQLIDDSEKIAEGISTNVFSVECTLDQFRRFSRAALSDGLILEDWALKILHEESLSYFNQTQTEAGLAAEMETIYEAKKSST
jgi:transcriptional regulator with XRE-family HTH domain